MNLDPVSLILGIGLGLLGARLSYWVLVERSDISRLGETKRLLTEIYLRHGGDPEKLTKIVQGENENDD